MRKSKVALALWLALATLLTAQSPARTLTFEDFLQNLRTAHPVAQQAALLDREAQAALLAAQGAFDPKLYGDWQRKSFDGKTYYSVGEGGVKWPAWYGLEAKAAYGFANGIFLNPENKLPANGQAVLGLQASLLQGLLMDERRAGLLQARILRQANEAERRLLLNDLLLEAAKAYWDWALADAGQQIYRQAVQVAATRLDGLRESWRQGDRPAIDTLEALIQVQDRQLELAEAQVTFRNTILFLQNFQWENGSVVPVDTSLRPVPLLAAPAFSLTADAAADSLVENHPAVLAYLFKQQQLETERRLKAEQLKPRLDVSYNLLSSGTDPTPGGYGLFTNNYKWGVGLEFPLLLRKARGNLLLTDLKILDTGLALTQKRQEVRTKMQTYQNDLQILQQQIALGTQMLDNYARLVEAETIRFNIGETSLFLVNSRENKLIDAQLKLAKLWAEYRKAEAGLRWAKGGEK